MKQIICTTLLSTVLVFAVSAQSVEMRKKQFNLDRSGLAIQGYDPVAYFTNGKAIDGKKATTYDYRGANPEELE